MAIVVFACVLVPVVGSMADGGDSGGRGAITYTNVGDYYYKSATADSNEHVVNLEYTEITENQRSFTTVIKIDGTEIINDTAHSFADDVYYTFGWSDSSTYYISVVDGGIRVIENGSSPSVGLYGTYISETEIEGGYIARAQYIISNGVLSFTDGDGNNQSYPIDYYIDKRNGEYVLAETPVVSAVDNTPIRIGMSIVTVHMSTPITNYIYGLTDSESIINDSESISLSVGDTMDSTKTWQIDSSISLQENGNIIILNSITCDAVVNHPTNMGTYLPYSGTATDTHFIVPVTVTVPAEGGDSDNSVVSTLIGIIPVFVALALILYIVSMFYNPNRMD